MKRMAIYTNLFWNNRHGSEQADQIFFLAEVSVETAGKELSTMRLVTAQVDRVLKRHETRYPRRQTWHFCHIWGMRQDTNALGLTSAAVLTTIIIDTWNQCIHLPHPPPLLHSPQLSFANWWDFCLFLPILYIQHIRKLQAYCSLSDSVNSVQQFKRNTLCDVESAIDSRIDLKQTTKSHLFRRKTARIQFHTCFCTRDFQTF